MRSIRGRTAVCLATILTVVLLPASGAAADSATREDPDDSPGMLDLADARHGHQRVRDQRLIVHRIRTHDAWEVGTLVGSSFGVLFSTENGARPEFQLELHASEGRVEATMTNARGRIVGYAQVDRPDRHTVRIVFPRRLLGRNVDGYRWFAQTVYRSGSEGECGIEFDVSRPCPDRLPDRGSIHHALA